MPLVVVLDGAWNERPLAHLAEGVRHDDRWKALPAAMHLRASIAGDPAEDESGGEGEVRRGEVAAGVGRGTRMRRVLSSSEEAEARGMGVAQIERIRILVCMLTPAWVVTANRLFLELLDDEPQSP